MRLTSTRMFIAVSVLAAFVLGCSTESDAPTAATSQLDKTSAMLFAAPAGSKKIKDKYIVQFKDAVAATAVPGIARGMSTKHGLGVEWVYTHSVKGFSCMIPPGRMDAVLSDNNVLHVEEDYEMEITAGASKGRKTPGGGGGSTTPSPSPSEVTPWGVSAVGGAVAAEGKRAWVIDTGIDPNHTDLNVSTTLSATFVMDEATLTWNDLHGHGTHVAGTIAAKANGSGVVGVAAGATVIAVRVLGATGRGSYSRIIAGVDYVASKATPGDVVNMSLGGSTSSTLDNAVIRAASLGIKFALSAGNNAIDATQQSPARAEHFNIWTVSAHDANNTFATFSNYGAPVDICAPGVGILSTKLGGGTTTMSGTSMAAPHVAGLLLTGDVGSRGIVTGDRDGDPDDLAVRR